MPRGDEELFILNTGTKERTMNNLKNAVFLLAVSLGVAFPARAQLVTDFNPTIPPCCLSHAGANMMAQLQDWNNFHRYHEDNQRLAAAGPVAGRVVFLGDSITDAWDLTKYFPGKPYVNRGISGQTTAQMVMRMYPDVVRLHPAAFILLAGTNDITRNTGAETAEMVEDNFRAMSDLARANNIKIILCLLTPISDYAPIKQTPQRPPGDILNLNHWLESYARDAHAVIADYFTALVDDRGMLREGYSNDGLHPNAKGYELLAPVAEAAIEKALK
jgi:lysophospholipase L1-like esterase